MKSCERAIYELLKGFAESRVYALQAKQNTAVPFIVFQRTDSQRWRSMNNPSGMAQAYIQIDCYGKDYYEAKELAAAVETALDGYRGTVYHGNASPQDFTRIGGISLQSDLDLLDQTDEPLLFRNTATYLVTYEQ